MKTTSRGYWIVGALLITIAGFANADDEAVTKDRMRIVGTWRIVSLVINGNQASDADAKKLSVVNGSDNTWRLYSDGKEVAKGTNSLDPTKEPKTIDFTIIEGGGTGNVHLGIYELGEKTRRLCFAPPGKPRPTEFSSVRGSEHILVTFEREK